MKKNKKDSSDGGENAGNVIEEMAGMKRKQKDMEGKVGEVGK